MRTVAIVQARMGSTRFPNKVMKDIVGNTMIGALLKRLSISNEIDEVLLATSDNAKDDLLANHVMNLGFNVFRGNEHDVLDRYYQSAKKYNAEIVVRITGDCPLIDPDLVDEVVVAIKKSGVDYASNISPPTYPDGLDVEAFCFAALEEAWKSAKSFYEREHVTPYIKTKPNFNKINIENDVDFSKIRWTVDEPSDLDVINYVFNHFKPRIDFSWLEVLELYKTNQSGFCINRHLNRNEGSVIGSGQKLWKRAKQIIPGGNMLLSKRPEMYLPNFWPTYFSKAHGCNIWDLDGRKYIDLSIMGVGTNILGYGDPEVDEAVINAIKNGNMTTLNCPEEVYLAEKLIEIHPWASMVKFTRSGGEANAVAIRIARAAAGKYKVAFCGYHGWHDWYLAANIKDTKGLTEHLLPGLEPKGVPPALSESIYPFTYNNFDQVNEIVNNHEIGVIIMEVSRNKAPENNFLRRIRELCDRNGIVLIFDECTSGFRQTFGGLHKLYNISPDIAMFGKALGNGYAINAIIGKREVMEEAQKTFISSTFWTERIGPVAALKTLEIMEKKQSWVTITEIGEEIGRRWQELADYYSIPIDIYGLPATNSFSIKSKNNLAYKTLITQEMLSMGFLAGNSIYVSLAHTVSIINEYFDCLDTIFALIKKCEDGLDVRTMIKGQICHDGFKRLN